MEKLSLIPEFLKTTTSNNQCIVNTKHIMYIECEDDHKNVLYYINFAMINQIAISWSFESDKERNEEYDNIFKQLDNKYILS